MKLRGYVTVTVVGLVLVALDLVQRTVIVTAVTVVPRRRHEVLGRWQRLTARIVLALVQRVGGGSIGALPTIPAGADVLLVMNHQSILDIPIMIASLDRYYPRIVTRARYSRGKPLISHMTRLYQYPLVEPGATARGHMEEIARAAAKGATPLAIFPEGTRTRDGSIKRFKRLGLETILRQKRWEVYVLVVDGLWQAATLQDYIKAGSSIDAEVRCFGPFTSPDPDTPMEDFIEGIRERMLSEIEDMRGEGVTS